MSAACSLRLIEPSYILVYQHNLYTYFLLSAASFFSAFSYNLSSSAFFAFNTFNFSNKP
jgi:hypothetical protein